MYPSIQEESIEPIRNVVLLALTESLAQNEYTASKKLEVAASQNLRHRRGYITKLILATGKAGTGSVRTPACIVYFFRTDPAISLGATDLTDAQRLALAAKVIIADTDWSSDANGADVLVKDLEALHLGAAADLWVAVKSTDATTVVGDAVNGESLTLVDLTVEFVN